MNEFQLNICWHEFLYAEGFDGDLGKDGLWKESLRSETTIAWIRMGKKLIKPLCSKRGKAKNLVQPSSVHLLNTQW